MDWHAVADGLFDRGHDIVAVDDLLSGTGHCGDTAFAVVGLTNHAEIGVELTLAMAKRVVATMRDHPGRPHDQRMPADDARLVRPFKNAGQLAVDLLQPRHAAVVRDLLPHRDVAARDEVREATEAAAAKISVRFGKGPVDGKIQAHVITAG